MAFDTSLAPAGQALPPPAGPDVGLIIDTGAARCTRGGVAYSCGSERFAVETDVVFPAVTFRSGQ